MMYTDESVLFCTIEIVHIGKSDSECVCERWIRFDATGVPIWDHAYDVIANWLYVSSVDEYIPLPNPIFEKSTYWVTHVSSAAAFVRLVPPARGADAV